MPLFGSKDPHQAHGGHGCRDDHHGHHGHHAGSSVHHVPVTQPVHGHGDLVHFTLKQVSLFGDKHVHVQLWLDGQCLDHVDDGALSVLLTPGRHTIGIAVHNPSAVFDARHARQPEDTASFTLKDMHGLLGLFNMGRHERRVVVEYAVKENLLTKTATAQIRRIRTLR